MREIKFRSWDTEKNKMVYDFSETEGLLHYITGLDGTGKLFVSNEGVEREYKIMQYTGLKDKNGVEIYEGDIVQGLIVSPWNKREILCEVIFRKSCFICVENDNRGTEHKLLFAKDITVVGNIHQNHELLK